MVMDTLVDGAIVHSLPDNYPALLTLRARNMPLVIVDAPALPGVPLVGIRDRQAAGSQMRHLLELGHQRIGILVERLRPDGRRGRADPARWSNSPERVVRERIEGYRLAYEEAGHRFDAVPIIEVGAFDRADHPELHRPATLTADPCHEMVVQAPAAPSLTALARSISAMCSSAQARTAASGPSSERPRSVSR